MLAGKLNIRSALLLQLRSSLAIAPAEDPGENLKG